MILVLEDEEWRAQFFREKIGAQIVTNNQTALLGALLVHLPEVTQVYLDHDLGLRVQDPYPREVTGYDCACAIESLVREGRVDLSHVEFVIHSLNPSGASRIALALTAAGLKVRRTPMHDLMALHGADIVTMPLEAP